LRLPKWCHNSWPVSWPESQEQRNQPQIADCLFIFAVVIVSALPYMFSLGFYCNDWGYMETLQRFSGHGLGTIFREMTNLDSDLLLRPVQLTWLVLAFKVFGRNATPYHMVISAVISLVAVLLYLMLRELRSSRWLALSIALVFGVLPHYSTDKVWISSNQAGLCMAFALFGIYGLSKSLRSEERHSTAWIVLAVFAFVLSVLSYEVAIGLIVASAAIIAWRKFIEDRRSFKSGWKTLAYLAGTIALLVLIFLAKSRMQTRLAYHHHLFSRLGVLSWHAMDQAVRFNFWTYGLHMPSFLLGMLRESALNLAALGAAATIAVVVTVYLWRTMESAAIPSWRVCLWLIVIGFVLFALGYALFFHSPFMEFNSQEYGNRVVIASALGAAFVLVAVAGLVCSIVKSGTLRVRAFSVAMGLICGVNSLAACGIAHYWVDAAEQQSEVLKSVSANVHALPHDSVLLLDGFCPNSGPVLLFYSDYDATSALHFALGDDSLHGDVISSNAQFGPEGVDGYVEGQYPYGDRLFVYNVQHEYLASLPSQAAANQYLQAMRPAGSSGCPAT
jgi:hypothetical protein